MSNKKGKSTSTRVDSLPITYVWENGRLVAISHASVRDTQSQYAKNCNQPKPVSTIGKGK